MDTRPKTLDLLLHVMRELRRNYDAGAAELGLTMARARVLTTLAGMEGATQAELDELAPMLDAIKDAKTDQEGAEATFQFHHALSVLSRNTFLPLLYNSIHSYGLHFWSLYRQRYGANRLYQNKLELYRALLDRDAERAQAFTSDMLDSVANGAFSLYSHPDQTSHSV